MARKKNDTTNQQQPQKSKKEPRTVYVGQVPVVLINPDSINTTLRLTYPKMGEAADYKKSRSYAIKGKCLDCSGGNRAAVAACPVQACFLWAVRPFKEEGHTERQVGVVPSKAEYKSLHDIKESKYDRSSAVAALAKSRADDDEDDDDDDIDVEVEVEYE
jgi:hypothetical protein